MTRQNNIRSNLGLLAAIAAVFHASLAHAQCGPRWVKDLAFSTMPEFKDRVQVGAMAAWDPDGTGPQAPRLVIATIGRLPDNSQKTILFQWLDGQWTRLPGIDQYFVVKAIAAMPDGRLYIGGRNGTGGTGALRHLAQLVGESWIEVGGGVAGGISSSNPTVYTLAPLANGALLVGGNFTSVGGLSASCIAIWDGSTWSPLGSGMNNTALSAAQLSNGDVIAGGQFSFAGGVYAPRVARWIDGVWSAISSETAGGLVSKVFAMPDNKFVIGGAIFGIGAGGIAGFDGSSWFAYGKGVGLPASGPNDPFHVPDLLATDDGDLIAAGGFGYNGEPRYLARWDGSGWQEIGSGINKPALCVASLPDGTIAVGGTFTLAGSRFATGIARFTYAPCTADFNNDCFLSFEDADAMMSAFDAGESRADLDGDGMLTFNDVDAFLTAFEEGC